jgi:hypothetical protein
MLNAVAVFAIIDAFSAVVVDLEVGHPSVTWEEGMVAVSTFITYSDLTISDTELCTIYTDLLTTGQCLGPWTCYVNSMRRSGAIVVHAEQPAALMEEETTNPQHVHLRYSLYVMLGTLIVIVCFLCPAIRAENWIYQRISETDPTQQPDEMSRPFNSPMKDHRLVGINSRKQ